MDTWKQLSVDVPQNLPTDHAERASKIFALVEPLRSASGPSWKAYITHRLKAEEEMQEYYELCQDEENLPHVQGISDKILQVLTEDEEEQEDDDNPDTMLKIHDCICITKLDDEDAGDEVSLHSFASP